ncbi:hypothetical protein J4217_02890 [Candidatus Pacearchaeota archaeon]|nr:hypothetical protein [Candidatus Pacearchaeota archaeon]
MALKTGDLVLCTVAKIEGTTVFVNVEEENMQGTIVFSEIAAGRIRNIREYAVPNKKIVCKVLKIYPDHTELTYRRVTGSEREAIMEKHKQEQTFKTMLKQVTKTPESIITKIKENYTIQDFLAKVKEDIKLIEQFFKKEESLILSKMLTDKKEKPKEAKKKFILRSDSDSGVNDIKSILNVKDVKISYLGSSQFAISCIGRDFKEANQKLDKAIEEIKAKAKDKKAFFELKEK